MSNIDFQRNKRLLSNNQSNQNSENVIVVATVTDCLASHDECTGRYMDFSYKYTVFCDCICHKEKHKIEKMATYGHNKDSIPVDDRSTLSSRVYVRS